MKHLRTFLVGFGVMSGALALVAVVLLPFMLSIWLHSFLWWLLYTIPMIYSLGKHMEKR
jgi:hypothetical protein